MSSLIVEPYSDGYSIWVEKRKYYRKIPKRDKFTFYSQLWVKGNEQLLVRI